MTNISIVQWNARSIRHKILELSSYSNGVDIFLISETWMEPQDNIRLKGFDVIRNDRIGRRGGGVLIFVCQGFKYSIMGNINDGHGSLEVCGIKVFTDQGTISIISLYRPPDLPNLSSQQWLNFFSQFQGDFLVGGNFNLPNNCIVPLLEGIEELDICLLNDNSPTYFEMERNYSSSLDLSFAKSSLCHKIDWSVGDDLWASDHMPIWLNMNARVSLKNRFSKRQRLHSSSTDWGIFRSSLKDRIEDLGETLLGDGNLDVQSIYSSFTSMISDCLSFASPKNNTSRILSSPRPVEYGNPLSSSYQSSSNFKKRSGHCPWWSEECDKVFARRKIALDNFKKSGTRDDFLLYKRECAKARIGLKNIKEDFRKFCESLRKDSNPTYIWKKVKSFQNYLNSSDFLNKYNQAIVDTIKNQISSLFPPWVRCAKIALPMDGFDPVLDLPFVVEELNAVLNNLKLKASPGLDNIDYKIISNLPNSARTFLLKLYNRIFSDQIILLEWTQYLVFFIPKDVEALKFRPISLASCLFKIMERLIANRLNWFVEYKEIFPRSQFGFRRNKSCIDNLAILQSEILIAFKKDRALPAAFLDIKSAYDNVLPNILISKLIDLGVSPNVTAFIQNATYARQVHCRFEDIDEIILTSKGLPQGSVLSPLLYNIYASEIESKCVGD